MDCIYVKGREDFDLDDDLDSAEEVFCDLIDTFTKGRESPHSDKRFDFNNVSNKSFSELFKRVVLPKESLKVEKGLNLSKQDFWSSVNSEVLEEPEVNQWENFDFESYFKYYSGIFKLSIEGNFTPEICEFDSDNMYWFTSKLGHFLAEVVLGRKQISDISKMEDDTLMFEFARLFWIHFYYFEPDFMVFEDEETEFVGCDEWAETALEDFNIINYLLSEKVQFIFAEYDSEEKYRNDNCIHPIIEFEFISGFEYETMIVSDSRGFELFRFLLID